MAKEYRINTWGQSYFGTNSGREFTIYFSEPDAGINRDTGLCLLTAGFGGDANANVYRKMRNQFADQYNLVTIQCDYFGYEFMTSTLPKDFFQLSEWLTPEEYDLYNHCLDTGTDLPCNIKKESDIELDETIDYFCEMGIFQAMDNLRAIKIVQDHIMKNGLSYNQNKIIGYGHSHGAYLLYMCNALYPNLFSSIIDNSAWLFPKWMAEKRDLFYMFAGGKIVLTAYIHYQGLQWIDDPLIYYLDALYIQFNNTCRIYSFHGETDKLISLEKKKEFLSKVDNHVLHVIGESDTDGEIFKNSSHGLGADFLKMFDYVYKKYDLGTTEDKNLWDTTSFQSKMYLYQTTMVNGVPSILRNPLSESNTPQQATGHQACNAAELRGI